MREREGGGGSGRGHERRARKRTGWKVTLNQRHKCADLPPSWRLTSTRTNLWNAVSVKNNAPRRSSKKWIERRGPCQCVSWFDGSRVACFLLHVFSLDWSTIDIGRQRRQSLWRATVFDTNMYKKMSEEEGKRKTSFSLPKALCFFIDAKRTMFTRASSPSLCFEARRCVLTLPAELGCGVSCCWRNCFFFPNFRHGEDSPQSPSWLCSALRPQRSHDKAWDKWRSLRWVCCLRTTEDNSDEDVSAWDTCIPVVKVLLVI